MTMIILISDHSHCHRQGVESWRLPETVGSFSAWTWTTSCRQRRFTFGQSQDDLHKIMMIMIIIKSKPRQILTIMTMAGIFTRWPSWDASSGDWIFSYSSFKARHGECVKQCPITIRSGFEITNVIFSGRNWTELLSPWAGCLYHGKGCKYYNSNQTRQPNTKMKSNPSPKISKSPFTVLHMDQPIPDRCQRWRALKPSNPKVCNNFSYASGWWEVVSN